MTFPTPTGQQVASTWIPVATRIPEPEVFVLCWDGRRCFVDWWGGLRDNGNGAIYWMPFPKPPGANDMYDGRRA
jgi:hypothetical protein